MGPTAGGAVYSPALTDWVFMVKKSSSMYITGPEVIKAVIGEEVSHDELGGAVAHATKSGVCHFATESDEDCLAKIRTLLSFLPDSCHSPLPVAPVHGQPGPGMSRTGRDHPGPGQPRLRHEEGDRGRRGRRGDVRTP